MMRFKCAFHMSVLLVAAGCTRVSIYVEHDPTASFANLTTYSWAGPTDKELTKRNPILDARITSAVETELAARGFTLTDAKPDFIVAYSAAIDDSLQAVTIDRYAGYTQSTYLTRAGTGWNYPRDTANRTTVVYEYQQGSLILDVSLPDPKRLIWRAYSRAVIDPNESQKKRDETLREAVRLMLKDFPPG